MNYKIAESSSEHLTSSARQKIGQLVFFEKNFISTLPKTWHFFRFADFVAKVSTECLKMFLMPSSCGAVAQMVKRLSKEPKFGLLY